MRRAQLLSVLMLIALATVVVTVLVTTARQSPNGAAKPAPAEPADAQAEPAPEGSSPSAENGSAEPTNGEPDAPSEPAEEADDTPAGPVIRRVALNGQDLADLLDLSMWKFKLRIPENEYTLYLWVERWTRHAQEPEIRELTTLSGVWADNELVLKLPTEQDDRLFLQIGNSISRSTEIPPIRPTGPWRRETIQRATLNPGRDVYLITYTHNELATATGGRVDVHRQNDETIYVKMRFTPGPFVPFDPERITADSY